MSICKTKTVINYKTPFIFLKSLFFKKYVYFLLIFTFQQTMSFSCSVYERNFKRERELEMFLKLEFCRMSLFTTVLFSLPKRKNQINVNNTIILISCICISMQPMFLDNEFLIEKKIGLFMFLILFEINRIPTFKM